MGEIIPFPVSKTCFGILRSNEYHVTKEGNQEMGEIILFPVQKFQVA